MAAALIPSSATPDRPAPAGTPQPLATSPPGRTTIVFACDDTAEVYNEYAKIERAFEKDNPDVDVELKSYRDLLGDQALGYPQTVQEIAARADVFCVWDVEPLVATDLLHDLDSLVAGDPAFQPGDFYPAVLDTGRYEGRLYAIPSLFQPALVRYDPQAFDEAGLPYPRPAWTWDEFAASAKVLTRRQDGNTLRWGFAEDGPAVFNARFRAALADPALAAAATAERPLSAAPVADLFRWYEGVYVGDRAAPVPRNLEDPASAYLPVYVDPRDVSRGKMAMWTDLMYQNARRLGKPAPFPEGPGRRAVSHRPGVGHRRRNPARGCGVAVARLPLAQPAARRPARPARPALARRQAALLARSACRRGRRLSLRSGEPGTA